MSEIQIETANIFFPRQRDPATRRENHKNMDRRSHILLEFFFQWETPSIVCSLQTVACK